MNDVYALLEQFKGNHFDFGMFQAKKLIESNYLIKMNTMLRKYTFDASAFYNAIKILTDFSPSLVEELKGLSMGLSLPLEDVFFRFSGYFQEVKSGCSIIMNESFMTRNYDQHPKSYDGRVVFFKPERGYATLGSSMLVTGRTDGMNEHGLVVAYNFVSVKGRSDGLTCNIITRILLESCKDVEEAVTLLKRLPHRTAFNYCLLDKSGTYCVVEASSQGVYVRNDNVCTNHFFIQDHLNPILSSNSKNRYNLMKETYQKHHELVKIYPYMNALDYGIFQTRFDLDDGTLHTSAYEPLNMTMNIAYGSNRNPISLDFKSWLDGEKILTTKIKGEGFPGFTFLYTKNV